MQADDMILISIDDPICEPAELFNVDPSTYEETRPGCYDVRRVRSARLCCFIEDPVGVETLDRFNLDNVVWESGFPHSDSSSPQAPENLAAMLADVPHVDTTTRVGRAPDESDRELLRELSTRALRGRKVKP